jgi:hypothetical protein
VGISELQAEVARRYARLALPSWPDPHPNMQGPADDEYSRVTEPSRYRIVHARVQVWAAVLEEFIGARVARFEGTVRGIDPRAENRTTRLTSGRSGTLPLLLIEESLPIVGQAGYLPVVRISVARPDAVVAGQPDCGCDACDSGSEDLLNAIDDSISRVVSGSFVALRGDSWHADWSPDSFSAGGSPGAPDYDLLRDLCQRLARGDAVSLPEGTVAFVGRSWL